MEIELQYGIKGLLKTVKLSFVKYNEGQDIPNSPGIYIFYNKYDEVLYIGESKNVSKRIREHLRGKNSFEGVQEHTYLKYCTVEADRYERHVLEGMLVMYCNPRYNYSDSDISKNISKGMTDYKLAERRLQNMYKGNNTKIPPLDILDMVYYVRELKYPRKYVADSFGVPLTYLVKKVSGSGKSKPRVELPENYVPNTILKELQTS